jgi:hypothetical protein
LAYDEPERKQKPRWLKRRELVSPILTGCLVFILSFLIGGIVPNAGIGYDSVSAFEFDLMNAVIIFLASFIAVEVNVNRTEGRTLKSNP